MGVFMRRTLLTILVSLALIGTAQAHGPRKFMAVGDSVSNGAVYEGSTVAVPGAFLTKLDELTGNTFTFTGDVYTGDYLVKAYPGCTAYQLLYGAGAVPPLWDAFRPLQDTLEEHMADCQDNCFITVLTSKNGAPGGHTRAGDTLAIINTIDSFNPNITVILLSYGNVTNAWGDINEDNRVMVVNRMATKSNLYYIPTGIEFIGHAEYLMDTIHPSQAGHDMMAQMIYDVIEPLINEDDAPADNNTALRNCTLKSFRSGQ
jgi:hypothetical protein